MSYLDHDLVIYRDKNGEPIVTDLSKTIKAHRKALEVMACQIETLQAQMPAAERWLLTRVLSKYREMRSHLNRVEV